MKYLFPVVLSVACSQLSGSFILSTSYDNWRTWWAVMGCDMSGPAAETTGATERLDGRVAGDECALRWATCRAPVCMAIAGGDGFAAGDSGLGDC